MTLIGANIGGLADGSGLVAGTDYNIPKPSVILDAGLSITRVGYKTQRFYHAPGYVVAMLDTVAKPLVAAGVMVVLDPHEFGSVWSDAANATISIASEPGTELWLKALLDLVAAVKAAALDEDHLCIGLQNEPGNALGDAAWMATCWQPAITQIRAAGFTGWIEVPVGGSQEAYKVSVAKPYPASVVDPLYRIVLGVHGYGDASNEGLGDASASATQMVGRFSGPIAWQWASGTRQGFTGIFASEFGTSSADPVSQADFAAVVALFEGRPDAVWGATAWTMDPWLAKNGNYLGTASAPTANLLDLEEVRTPLVVYLAGDSYQGPPVATITVDGAVVLADVSVTANRTEAPQAVRVPGVLAAGKHTVGVSFLADAWGGGVGLDRNLYVVAVEYAGSPCCLCPGDFAALATAGTHTVGIEVR